MKRWQGYVTGVSKKLGISWQRAEALVEWERELVAAMVDLLEKRHRKYGPRMRRRRPGWIDARRRID